MVFRRFLYIYIISSSHSALSLEDSVVEQLFAGGYCCSVESDNAGNVVNVVLPQLCIPVKLLLVGVSVDDISAE